jgi:Flp pilus assembly protein CpaB
MLPGGPSARPAAPAQGRGRHKAAKEPKPAKVVTQRSLSIYKIGIVVAIIVGLIAAVAIFSPTKQTYVAEASANIPPLAQVTSADVKAVPLALGDIQSGAFTGSSANVAIHNALKSIGTQEAAYPIVQGQQLSSALFNSPQVQTTPIPPGYRLISVSANTSAAVGGSLRPGNIVDLLVVEAVNNVSYAVVAATGLQLVAASTTSAAVPTTATKTTTAGGASSTSASASSTTTGVYVLKVPVAQVLAATLSDATGKVYLVLQGANPNPLPQLPESVQNMLCANSPATVTVPGALTISDCPLP